MKMINAELPRLKLFRFPPNSERSLSLVPANSGPDYLIYPMHWLLRDGRVSDAFLCLEFLGARCPLCRTDRRKQRVMMNIWSEDESFPRVWDINLFLLTKALGTTYSERTFTADSLLWDTSKYGISLDIKYYKSGDWPAYKINKRLRRKEIPKTVLDQTVDLRNVIYTPDIKEWTDEYREYQDQVEREKTKVADIVGEPLQKVELVKSLELPVLGPLPQSYDVTRFKIEETLQAQDVQMKNLLQMYGIKENQLEKILKEVNKQETAKRKTKKPLKSALINKTLNKQPDPYSKKVRRIIIMDEE